MDTTTKRTERLRFEQELATAQPRAKLIDEQVRTLVRSLGDNAEALADSDPKLKSQLYEELDISVTHDHTTRTVTTSVKVSVGGPLTLRVNRSPSLFRGWIDLRTA
jgi:hypothetical protein